MEQKKLNLIDIKLHGDRLLVFNPKDVERLRCNHRIVGAFIGPLARAPLQNSFLGLPLLLRPEEAELLTSKGLARISSSEGNASTWSFPDTAAEWIKYKVFEYLWHQGLFVTPGLKFGGHYLAYPGDPLRYHSHYIVNARDKETPLTPVDLVSMGRLAINVKKVYVLASPDDSGNINVFSIHWAGF
ncbi:hypothetical protein VTP01DRAFT_4950 [Rhizomucor pusillus]|uniref:uncharacterized protein n=1 Tax=Rhizomucor pusillus TaxID=4840 RepID=UPI00374456A9